MWAWEERLTKDDGLYHEYDHICQLGTMLNKINQLCEWCNRSCLNCILLPPKSFACLAILPNLRFSMSFITIAKYKTLHGTQVSESQPTLLISTMVGIVIENRGSRVLVMIDISRKSSHSPVPHPIFCVSYLSTKTLCGEGYALGGIYMGVSGGKGA